MTTRPHRIGTPIRNDNASWNPLTRLVKSMIMRRQSKEAVPMTRRTASPVLTIGLAPRLARRQSPSAVAASIPPSVPSIAVTITTITMVNKSGRSRPTTK